MQNDLVSAVLVVLGFQAGIGALLVLLTLLDPTSQRREPGARQTAPSRSGQADARSSVHRR